MATASSKDHVKIQPCTAAHAVCAASAIALLLRGFAHSHSCTAKYEKKVTTRS